LISIIKSYIIYIILKVEFKDIGKRKITNFVVFSEVGGILHVKDTTVEVVTIGGGNPLFGDKNASEISISNC
jgi:hypothetical protein